MCPHCGGRRSRGAAEPVRRNRKRRLLWIAACGAVLLSGAAALLAAGGARGGRLGSVAARALSPLKRDRWVRIAYGDLLDGSALVRTGDPLRTALRDPSLKGAVQPFLDPYSYLLQDAVQMLNGPDELPHESVVEQFPLGSEQPAWAAILRGGRIHVVFDGRRHVRAFLPGDRPEQAYEESYPIIRHCLNGLLPPGGKPLEVEVFAYRNDYATSELKLNTRPYRVSATSFPSRKRPVGLGGLKAFFAQGVDLTGAQLSKSKGLVLYGKTEGQSSLAGHHVSLSDFAVAYRAVFHAGENAAFISLDPHRDPTRTTVNFGGFLEDTYVGSVVLEADKRFKTITSGLDPNTFHDIRKETRQRVPSFMTVAERDLCRDDPTAQGRWIGTRFWFYPDNIGVDTDLSYEFAVVTRPQFTADAERSRDDFASPAEFERKKAATLSPSIRTNINHLNSNYRAYAAAFPEIQDLSTVARLMGIAIWLKQADSKWLDLDELLAVELPAYQTPREKTQLMAASILTVPDLSAATPDYAVAHAHTYYLSPVLDNTVATAFGSPAGVAKYLCLARGADEAKAREYEDEASQVWAEHGADQVRSIINTKSDLRALAQYAADSLPGVSSSLARDLKPLIERDEEALRGLEAQIDGIQVKLQYASGERYNDLVDEHNKLVRQHEQVRRRYDENIQRYNQADRGLLQVLEIGGGIDLEPTHFRLRRLRESPELTELKRVSRQAGRGAGAPVGGRGWVRSTAEAARDRLRVRSLRRIAWEVAAEPSTPQRSRNYAHSETGQKAWRTVEKPAGSWRTLATRAPSEYRETLYDAKAKILRVAEFRNGRVTEYLQGDKVSGDRIVFRRPRTANLIAPVEPPAWWSAAQ